MLKLQFIPHSNSAEVISYLTMRKLIGIFSLSLPIVLIIGSLIFSNCNQILSSISEYYHSNMRDVFVGILCAISLFLFSYKGYDIKDFIATKLASILALGIAFFPTTVELQSTSCIIQPIHENHIFGIIHLVSAALFFILLAYMSLFLFTKSNKTKSDISIEKKIRNIIYRVCGIIMIICIIIIAIITMLPKNSNINKYSPVFWLETIALFAFGISWLIKGKSLFKDKVKN